MSLFSAVQQAPADPILGMTEAFNRDPRAEKINLGVGVYLDETGKLPLMEAVRIAQQSMGAKPWSYLPIDGLKAYDKEVRDLVFGSGNDLVEQGRVVTVQSLGGTGALKIGAELLRRVGGATKVLVSDPSWENHRALFQKAGYEVCNYRYYNAAEKAVDFMGMLEDLAAADAGTVVVLHPCCHNPTGYDLTDTQWDEVVAICNERGLVPFIDMAYQGFGRGLTADGTAVAKFAAAGEPFLVSQSFSKTFGLYGERVGTLSIVAPTAAMAGPILSQTKVVIRTTYSNPPTHGAAVVAHVLTDPDLRNLWESELESMRLRIAGLRTQLVDGLAAVGIRDMGFIAEQRGMFSYSGLTAQQMARLRDEYAIYGLDSGRICVAALNSDNLDKVIQGIASVRA